MSETSLNSMKHHYKLYNGLFPKSTIYSFEPFPQSFATLQENLRPYPNVHVFNFGLADRSGPLPFHDNTSAATNSLLEPDAAADMTWGVGAVKSKGIVIVNSARLTSLLLKMEYL